MRKFDTKVQHLKYKVLREVARQAWNDFIFQQDVVSWLMGLDKRIFEQQGILLAVYHNVSDVTYVFDQNLYLRRVLLVLCKV